MASALPTATAPLNNTNPDSTTSRGPTLTSADFLKILVAEFANQDPTAPSDPTQYATQIVQFSNLGQLQNIDTAVTQTPGQELMQASSAYIGKEVVAAGNQIGVQGGKATSIAFTPSTSDSYTALVFNSSNQQVDSVSLGSLDANSLQTFAWQPGSSIGDGVYTTKIVNSKNVALGGLLEQGIVQSVNLTNGGIVLNMGNLSISEDQITRIAQP